MNQVSWLLYFAGLADTLRFGLPPLLFLSVFPLGLGWFGAWSESAYSSKKMWPNGSKFMRWFTSIWIAFIVVCFVIPTKDTVMAIAVSEFGQKYLQTGSGVELQGLMNDTLKLLHQQITGALK